MSSRDIAKLVSSRHDKVKQSVERLAGRGIIGVPHWGNTLKPRTQATEYQIGKRDSYVIVATFPGFTGRLVDHWQELEEWQADAA